jgi:glycerophosphoryl diester phosphodiesterase
MTAIYAHRGNVAFPDGTVPDGGPPGGKPARENTLEAFGAARRAGADGVELDVRLSADDLPVIHHDRRLPDGRAVANIPRALIPHFVPSLEEALAACTGMSVNVEIKQESGPGRPPPPPPTATHTATAVAEVLGRLALPPARSVPAPSAGLPPVLVSSFDEESLATVRARQPAVPVGLLIDWRTDPGRGLERAAALGCATLHPFVTQVDAALVAAAAGAGIGLHVWTVNADADLAAMADLQVAAVITDRVTAARRLLRPPVGPNGGGVTG